MIGTLLSNQHEGLLNLRNLKVLKSMRLTRQFGEFWHETLELVDRHHIWKRSWLTGQAKEIFRVENGSEISKVWVEPVRKILVVILEEGVGIIYDVASGRISATLQFRKSLEDYLFYITPEEVYMRSRGDLKRLLFSEVVKTRRWGISSTLHFLFALSPFITYIVVRRQS